MWVGVDVDVGVWMWMWMDVNVDVKVDDKDDRVGEREKKRVILGSEEGREGESMSGVLKGGERGREGEGEREREGEGEGEDRSFYRGREKGECVREGKRERALVNNYLPSLPPSISPLLSLSLSLSLPLSLSLSLSLSPYVCLLKEL